MAQQPTATKQQPLSENTNSIADQDLRLTVILGVLASGLEDDKRFPWNKAEKIIAYIKTGNPDGSVKR